MDFPEWQNSKQHHEHFKAEERMENKGKTRKKTIFKDMVTDVPETDPRKNIFYMDKVDEKDTVDSTSWLSKDAVNGLMNHAMSLTQAKANVVKETREIFGQDGEEFDKFHPQDNIKLGDGPIPFSYEQRKRVPKIKVADHGPAIEEVTGFGEDADADNSEVSRPKPIKALSDKRKAALLKRGDPNPAANLRSELAYKAELEQYKKSKGFVVEQHVDHSVISSYGSIDIRRRKKDPKSKEVFIQYNEEQIAKLNEEIAEKKKEEAKHQAEQDMLMKEKQLVARRIKNWMLDEQMKKHGILHRVGSYYLSRAKYIFGKYEEPTTILPFVWLGNADTARDSNKLRELGITHILNTAADVENAFPELFIYCKISMEDSEQQEFEGVFDYAFKFINRVEEIGGRVFIHCSAGVSRAATIAIGYMIYYEKMALLDAFLYVKNKRHIIDPNSNFMYQLALLELQTLGRTTVAFAKKWRNNGDYLKLKNGLDDEFQDEVVRKSSKGLMWIMVFGKVGKKKQRSKITKLLDMFFIGVLSAQSQPQRRQTTGRMKSAAVRK
ncbi:hypothetical protein ScalyP_jg308 [Parmales sp. scaly parma]|nr:hypothetical protein ScalyP_jg308 [Parmales sp. scaly parma]